MSFVSAIALIIFVILVYYILFLFYSVMFRITGITKDKSKFQAVSLLTNAGYTTTESEIITGDKTRRTIAKAAMLTGYFFSVVIVSLFINLFLSIDFTHLHQQVWLIVAGLGGLTVFFLILQIPFVKKGLDDAIDNLTVRLFKRVAKENFISVLDNYGEDAICKVFLYRVPEILKGKTVIDADIKNKYNVNILMYERNEKVHYVVRDTMFSDKDSLLVFGKLDSIRSVFLIKERKEGNKDIKKTDRRIDLNEVAIIENYDYQVLADILVRRVPEILREKTLIDSHIKDFFQINVMMVSRNGKPINLTKDTIIEQGDKVIAFGPYQNIETVFGQREEAEML